MLINIIAPNNLLFNTLNDNCQSLMGDLWSIRFYNNINEINQNDKPNLLIYNCIIRNELRSVPRIILGVDIIQPFHISKLMNLIQNKLLIKQYIIGKYNFCTISRTISSQDKAVMIKLTEKESELLIYLLNKGQVGAKAAEIIRDVWHYADATETSTIDSHIYRLRQKLIPLDLNDIISINDKRYTISI